MNFRVAAVPLFLPDLWRSRLNTSRSKTAPISVEFLSTFVTGSLSIDEIHATSTASETSVMTVAILSCGGDDLAKDEVRQQQCGRTHGKSCGIPVDEVVLLSCSYSNW